MCRPLVSREERRREVVKAGLGGMRGFVDYLTSKFLDFDANRLSLSSGTGKRF